MCFFPNSSWTTIRYLLPRCDFHFCTNNLGWTKRAQWRNYGIFYCVPPCRQHWCEQYSGVWSHRKDIQVSVLGSCVWCFLLFSCRSYSLCVFFFNWRRKKTLLQSVVASVSLFFENGKANNFLLFLQGYWIKTTELLYVLG